MASFELRRYGPTDCDWDCLFYPRHNRPCFIAQTLQGSDEGFIHRSGGETEFHEDIRSSCLREIKEETGLTVDSLALRGIVKTILEDDSSSWWPVEQTLLYAQKARCTSANSQKSLSLRLRESSRDSIDR